MFLKLSDLSILNPPPGDCVMVVLKGYFDDSGDEEDRQHRACSLSGYIGTFDNWEKFEKDWKNVLDDENIPYLHMKEFAHFRGPFKKYKNKPVERKNVLISLIRVIRECNLYGISTSLLIEELRQFNKDNNICIEAYPFSLYWNMMQISLKWNKTPIQLTVDKTNNVEDKIKKARNYAKTDLCYPDCDKHIIILPLNDDFTFRKVLPLQAADLLAWEFRKDATTKDKWIEDKNMTDEDSIKFRYHRPYSKKK